MESNLQHIFLEWQGCDGYEKQKQLYVNIIVRSYVPFTSKSNPADSLASKYWSYYILHEKEKIERCKDVISDDTVVPLFRSFTETNMLPAAVQNKLCEELTTKKLSKIK